MTHDKRAQTSGDRAGTGGQACASAADSTAERGLFGGEAADGIVSRPWSTSARSWAVALAGALLILSLAVIAWRVGKPWPQLCVSAILVGVALGALRSALRRRGDAGGDLERLY